MGWIQEPRHKSDEPAVLMRLVKVMNLMNSNNKELFLLTSTSKPLQRCVNILFKTMKASCYS